MSFPVKVVIGIWLIALVLIGWHITAHAHETAAAEGIPDYVYLSGCCNKNDCRLISTDAVQLTYQGYAFKLEQLPNDLYTVKEEEAQDSSDGRYWGCFYIPTVCTAYGPERTGQYGEKYAPCIKWKDDTSKRWDLRSNGKKKCFWRPANV